jgi:hypothetical protein
MHQTLQCHLIDVVLGGDIYKTYCQSYAKAKLTSEKCKQCVMQQWSYVDVLSDWGQFTESHQVD